MKQYFIIVAALLLPVSGWAAEAIYPNDKIDIDWSDKAAMQRGARTFVNYCLSCHSAKYSRYNRVGQDLGISDELLLQSLIFTTDEKGEKTKVGALMKTTMTKQYGELAFGVAPPDLSLIARSRGVDWLYNYLRGFYVDEARQFGMNNGVFESVAMPHVLVELQGYQMARKEMRPDGSGGEHEVIVGFDLIKPGSLTTAEYDATVHDLVAFLDYLAEPYKQTRKNVGTGVIIFLFLLLILTYFLKKEFWKDIH
ncbi:MAG: cytochrome c1 [Gammaproteobacteria bacterium]|nr:cytochrome c1 [Gammaproteobacteria bacterium]